MMTYAYSGADSTATSNEGDADGLTGAATMAEAFAMSSGASLAEAVVLVVSAFDDFSHEMARISKEIEKLARPDPPMMKPPQDWQEYLSPLVPDGAWKQNRKNNRQMLIKRRYCQGIQADTKGMSVLLLMLAVVCLLWL